MAKESGRRIIEMVKEDLKPSQIMTREAFENAIRIDLAIGGSANIPLVMKMGEKMSTLKNYSHSYPAGKPR